MNDAQRLDLFAAFAMHAFLSSEFHLQAMRKNHGIRVEEIPAVVAQAARMQAEAMMVALDPNNIAKVKAAGL